MNSDIVSKVYYLDRAERFQVEKPFNWSTELDVLNGLPKSNHLVTPHAVTIHDINDGTHTSLDTHGFAFVKSTTFLNREDFDNEALIEATYYSEIEDLLWRERPDISGIAFLGHQVRKRSAKFPHEKGALVPFAQPQTLAHADLTLQGARSRLETYYKDDPSLGTRPWEMLNFWRVLKGPSNDWPLAVCDYRSIDVEHDTIANDIVVAHGSGSIENALLHFNQQHEWFYKSDMNTDDVIIFRQVDSSGSMPRAWHASFDHPAKDTSNFVPRESIEVRVVAFK